MKTVKYFSATWCQPCKHFKPVMQEIANEGYSVQFIDMDTNEVMAREYNVRSVPTCVIEENGNEIHRLVGVVPKATVIANLT
jgi:thioredoxin 1